MTLNASALGWQAASLEKQAGWVWTGSKWVFKNVAPGVASGALHLTEPDSALATAGDAADVGLGLNPATVLNPFYQIPNVAGSLITEDTPDFQRLSTWKPGQGFRRGYLSPSLHGLATWPRGVWELNKALSIDLPGPKAYNSPSLLTALMGEYSSAAKLRRMQNPTPADRLAWAKVIADEQAYAKAHPESAPHYTYTPNGMSEQASANANPAPAPRRAVPSNVPEAAPEAASRGFVQGQGLLPIFQMAEQMSPGYTGKALNMLGPVAPLGMGALLDVDAINDVITGNPATPSSGRTPPAQQVPQSPAISAPKPLPPPPPSPSGPSWPLKNHAPFAPFGSNDYLRRGNQQLQPQQPQSQQFAAARPAPKPMLWGPKPHLPTSPGGSTMGLA